MVVALLAGFGWTYTLHGAHLLSRGPQIRDALPLLQLAGYDVQPLARVLVAWLLAGFFAGLALGGLRRPARVAVSGLVALALLLAGSQAAYALTRNLPFAHVLLSRMPGLGPWLEAAILATGAGCVPRYAWRGAREAEPAS